MIRMTDQSNKDTEDFIEKKGEKIIISEKIVQCFACGEKIESNTKICPYCETLIG